MSDSNNFQQIVSIVKTKASLKQEIYRNTLAAFELFKSAGQNLVQQLSKDASDADKAVEINHKEKGDFEFQLKIGGDIVLFHMHTNVFDFDQQHAIFKTGYLKEDRNRSFCGVINVYNFLADSLKYSRYEDSGYLIGRIFINKDNHFFVEGRRKLNFIHNDFINETINEDAIIDVIEHSILYSMGFDLFVPPYQAVQEINVGQLMSEASSMRIKTAKRMGYKFSFED